MTADPHASTDRTRVDSTSVADSLDLVGRVALDGVLGRLLGREQGVRLGRYRVVETVGAGAFGQVFRARDAELDRDVAIKVMLPARSARADEHERMLREARALARLRHPNVVEIFDVGVGITGHHDGGAPQHGVYIVMQWLPGESLAAFAATRPGHVALVDAWVQVARGLDAAHRDGLVHGDVKPDNVIIDAVGRVRVVDFGLARETVRPSSTLEGSGETDVTSISGTPVYMAPEQHRGVMSAAADQFALCVSLWRSLYDALPFSGDSLEALAAAKVTEPPRPGAIAVPRPVVAVLRRGLAPDPRQRWPSVGALADALERAVRPRRSVWSIAAGIGVLGATLAAGAVGAKDQHPCDATPLDPEATWNDSTRGAMLGHLAGLDHPDATMLADRLATALDRRASSWRRAYDDVCTAPANDPSVPAIHACLAEVDTAIASFVADLPQTDPRGLVALSGSLAAVAEPQHCAELGRRSAAEMQELEALRIRGAQLHAAVNAPMPVGDLSWVDAAVERAAALGDASLAIELQHDAGIAAMDGLDVQESVTRLRDAVARANANDEPLRAIELVPTLIEAHLDGREYEEVQRLIAGARQTLEQHGGSPRHGAMLDGVEALYFAHQGDVQRSDALYQRACDTLVPLPEPTELALYCSTALMVSALWEGDVDRAEAVFERGVEVASRAKDATEGLVLDIDFGRAELAQARGRLDDAAAILTRDVRRGELRFDRDHPGVVSRRMRLAKIDGARGHYDEAFAALDDVLARIQPSQEGTSVTELAHIARTRLNLTLFAGRFDEIGPAVDTVLRVTEGSRAAEWFQPWARIVLAFEAWHRGDLDAASLELARASSRLKPDSEADNLSAARLALLLDAERGAALGPGEARLAEAQRSLAALRAEQGDGQRPDPTEPVLDALAVATANGIAGTPDPTRRAALRELYFTHARAAGMLRRVAFDVAVDHF